MWRAIGASVIGTSHQKTGMPCQDACNYYSTMLGADRVLLVAIADGAGSAKASDVGSQEAVTHLLREIANSDKSLLAIDKETAAGWFQNTRLRLEALGEDEGIAVRDLACTLMFAILSDHCGIFGQIGDGAWITRKDATYVAATWPTGGEYANQTTFITSPNWKEAMQFVVMRETPSEVAGFTDGLQNVALHFLSKSVHAPFFDSKFTALRATEDETSLHAPLMDFLSSAGLCERTDDDKTLVLACREEIKILGDTVC